MGRPRQDGSDTFQAEILFTFSQAQGANGRQRVMCIRGPFRPEKRAAQDDADAMLKAANEHGISKVREMATTMKRPRAGI